ncbi:MAG: rhodanese-like domain-containing protein [Hyphomicrobiaceae bacterium]|nr:rhodanese-like domain-containing protein [Hyphomicrobiaceae bacterium]
MIGCRDTDSVASPTPRPRLLLGVAAALALLALLPVGALATDKISAAEAHAKASSGAITLIDVRTPDEWKQTGVPASAYTITMHQPGPQFLAQLDAVLGGDRTKPVAVICHTGSRTGALVGPMRQVGFANVIDVSEGMAGGRNGTGWAKSGLPIRRWAPGQDKPQLPSKLD